MNEIIEMLKLHIKNEIDLLPKNQKKVLDYITNLQKEIEKLTAESTEWESKCYDLQKENEELKTRIEKVKKYIDEHYPKQFGYNYEYYLDGLEVMTIYNLLKGGDKNDN